uniref:prevent-host-death protein n=1 Tax=Lactococcus garvieae TaxID=1363 RepID=UPI00359CA0E1
MENMVPVSEMRYYNQTLSDVSQGSQVILTKNGAAKYAVVDFGEWEKTKATIRLLEELQKGYHSLKAEKNSTPNEFAERLGVNIE